MLVFFTFWSTCYSIGNSFSQDIIGGMAFKRPNWIGQNSLTSKKRIVCFQLYLYLYFLNTSWKSKLELDLTERRVVVTIDRVAGSGIREMAKIYSPPHYRRSKVTHSWTQMHALQPTNRYSWTHINTHNTQLNTDTHKKHTVEHRYTQFTHSWTQMHTLQPTNRYSWTQMNTPYTELNTDTHNLYTVEHRCAHQ